MESTRRFTLPFTSRYDCPIVSNESTAGSIVIHYLIIGRAAKQREQ